MLIFQLLLQTGSCYTFPAGTEKLEQQVLIFHRKDKNTQKSYQFSDFTQRSTMQNRCIPIRRISLVDVAGVRVKLWLVYIYIWLLYLQYGQWPIVIVKVQFSTPYATINDFSIDFEIFDAIDILLFSWQLFGLMPIFTRFFSLCGLTSCSQSGLVCSSRDPLTFILASLIFVNNF